MLLVQVTRLQRERDDAVRARDSAMVERDVALAQVCVTATGLTLRTYIERVGVVHHASGDTSSHPSGLLAFTVKSASSFTNGATHFLALCTYR